jgi:hypothetical protein
MQAQNSHAWEFLRYGILPVSDDNFKIDVMFLMQKQLRN